MKLANKTIAFAITGSFCTFSKIRTELANLIKEDVNIIPIFSFNTYTADSRFGKAKEFVPFGQDNCIAKPNSMIAHTELIIPTLKEALDSNQLQPVILS